jgi:hypothetical protein
VGGDLVEAEGVNAGSAEAMRDAPPTGDPVPGGTPEHAEEHDRAEPVDHALGAPPDSDADGVYGSMAAGSS